MKKIFGLLGAAISAAAPALTLAQPYGIRFPSGGYGGQYVPSSQPRIPTGIIGILDTLVGYAVGIVIAISVLYIIYGAFIFMTKGETATERVRARDILLYSVVAIAIALASSFLVNLVVDAIFQANLVR